MKKTLAMILAVFMILSVTAVAFGESASSLNEGRAGAWTEIDTEIIQQQMIVIKKDLVSYNASSTEVFAPAFAWNTYCITAFLPDIMVQQLKTSLIWLALSILDRIQGETITGSIFTAQPKTERSISITLVRSILLLTIRTVSR